MDIKIKLHNTKIFDNNLAAICKTKTTLMFNKPVYVGMCTLELKSTYGNKSKIISHRYLQPDV